MSPARIRKRVNKNSVSWQVVYRRGGRGFAVESAGTFRVKREAELRRDLIGGWLAAGLDPRVELARLAEPVERRTLAVVFARFVVTREDVGAKAQASYRNARDRILPVLGELEPHLVTAGDVQTWIASCADLSPATVQHYLSTLRQVLAFADVEPNPASSPKVRVRSAGREEVSAPGFDEWERIRAALGPRYLLPFRLVEACGLRAGETRALQLGDVDFVEGRLRISRARTKGRTAGQRWLPVPSELLDEVAALWPLEDRERDRPVFALGEHTLRHALTRACRFAGVAHYSPHQLRHRRISLWTLHGFDPLTVKTWSGHAHASMSLDVYGHVLLDRRDEWQSFWVGAYARQVRVRAAEARAGEVPVMPEEPV